MQNFPDSVRIERLAELESRNLNEPVQTGFLAQEVEQICKNLGYSFSGLHVPENNTDNYSIAYGSFVPLLVKAVQEQQAMIDDQKSMIAEQQLMIIDLVARLDALEKDRERSEIVREK